MAWNRGTEDALKDRQPPVLTRSGCFLRVRKLIAFALVATVMVVCGIVAWHFLGRGDEVKPSKEKRAVSLIKAVTPSPAPKALPIEKSAEEIERELHPGMRKASNGVWFPTNRPFRAGSRYSHNVRTNAASFLRAQNSVHHTGVEQIMLNIFSCELGDMPRPLPSHLPENEMKRLAEILISKDDPKDADTDAMMVSREILAAAKKEMIKFIKEGGEPEDFIVNYYDQLERAFIARNDAITFVNELVRNDEDPAVISKFVDKTNEKFAAQGIKEIEKPEVAEDLQEQVE